MPPFEESLAAIDDRFARFREERGSPGLAWGVIRDGALVHPDVGCVPGSVGVRDGRIVALFAPGEEVTARAVVDCAGKWIMPGIIDPHVHFGFGSPETDFLTESRSAALGGVTSALSFYRTADFREAFKVGDSQVGVCWAFGDDNTGFLGDDGRF